MKLELDIPEYAAAQFKAAGVDVATTALQGLALLGYRRRALSVSGIAALFGEDARWGAWDFLKNEKEPNNMTVEDWQQEERALEQMRAKREQSALVRL